MPKRFTIGLIALQVIKGLRKIRLMRSGDEQLPIFQEMSYQIGIGLEAIVYNDTFLHQFHQRKHQHGFMRGNAIACASPFEMGIRGTYGLAFAMRRGLFRRGTITTGNYTSQ